MSYDHGRFVWFELLTQDIDKAKAFYTETLSWSVEPMDMGGFTYQLFKQGDKDIGGMMPPPMEGIPPHWLGYVSVEDVDATAQKIIAAGGKALADAMEIGTVGRIQPVQDPQGGVFALFKASEGDPSKSTGPGSWHWNELWTADPAAALAFYEDVFGYTHETMEIPEGHYYILKNGESPRGGLMKSPREGIPTCWVQYVEVADTDATVARATSLGASVMVPPTDAAGIGRFSLFQDSVGAVIGVIKPAG